MLAFLTDENFKGDIVRGLRHQRPELDLARVQDVGLSGAADEVILEQAAREARLLLTHDWPSAAGRANGRVRLSTCPCDVSPPVTLSTVTGSSSPTDHGRSPLAVYPGRRRPDCDWRSDSVDVGDRKT